MDRLVQFRRMLEHDWGKANVIEPHDRKEEIISFLKDYIDTYKPGVLLKAGLGQGEILKALTLMTDAYIVVVEPSMQIIHNYLDSCSSDAERERVRFINGEFSEIPADYYAADSIVCIDYFEFMNTSRAVDEFRRVLEFDGTLLLGTPVLSDQDMDGFFDDYIREILPLHNDYYLPGDLKTFLDLNDFSFVREDLKSYVFDAGKYLSLRAELGYPTPEGDPFAETEAKVNEIYGSSEGEIVVPYFTGVFMREKIK